MRRDGYQISPAGQGGVQHSAEAQSPNGLGGSGGLLYSQINSSLGIVAGTETRFNKIAIISAGTLSAGCYVRYNAWGYYTVVVGTPALTIISRLYSGAGTSLALLAAPSIPVAPNGVSFVNWRVESGFVVRVPGGAATVFSEPSRSFYNQDNTTVIPTVTSLGVGLQTPYAIDVGQETVLGMSALWTPSDASNQVFMTGSEVFVDYPVTTS